MTAMIDIIVGLMIVAGACFSCAAGLGLVRLNDVYMRMHAASKAGTLGSGVLLLALGFYASDWSVLTRALAGVVFFLLTAPVSAHLIARAAHKVGYMPCSETVVDKLADAEKKSENVTS
ncbi:monovalent cation/H(+) antiporter subunit G [Polycladidibacter stylochi]|uniref:monovalent cation/H(+) antiporter subunit G n=1 Tax=Polycladidibacter stylochi TaxID=1807766 RepID=UPI000836CBD0|nr:monovalent cation/H(+) antiporter subunit G [Pseudovibrio stylochi]